MDHRREDTAVPSHKLLLSGLDPHGAGYYDMHQTKLFLALIFNRVDVAHRYVGPCLSPVGF